MIKIQLNAAERFLGLMRIVCGIAEFLGANCGDPNFRMNWRTVITMLAIVIYALFNLSTLAQKYANKNWLAILQMLCTLFIYVQGVTKFVTVLIHVKEISATRLLLEQIYEDYVEKGLKYQKILHSCCDVLWKLMLTIGFCYIFLMGLMVAVPVGLVLFTGRHYFIFNFYLPGLDVETEFGYFVTLGVHAFCMFICCLGLYSTDLFIVSYLTQSYAFIDIFKLKVDEFNEKAEDINYCKSSKAATDLIDIVQWHQLYLRFSDSVGRCFSPVITCQVSTSGMGIIFAIITIMISDWPNAYPLFILSLYTLYVFCILGTRVQICNDEFCYAIYDISWYKLSAVHQKTVRLMLMRAQRVEMVRVAGVLPLSVSTALQITKGVYSTTMMLIQFLSK